MKRLSLALLLAGTGLSQDPLLKPTDEPQAFTYHSALVAGWGQFATTTRLEGTREAVQLFDVSKMRLFKQSSKQRTYTTFNITDEGLAVRAGIRTYSDIPYVDCWLRVVYGHRGTSKVTWQRLNLSVKGPAELSVDQALGQVGHGQGVLVRWRYDFARKAHVPMRLERRRARGLAPPPYFTIPARPRWLVVPAPVQLPRPRPYEQTPFVPAYPGRTGDQENFGFNHILADLWSGTNGEQEWFRFLCTEAGRPGHWFNTDGTLVSDNTPTTNLLVGEASFHPKCKGYETQAWFKPRGDWVAR